MWILVWIVSVQEETNIHSREQAAFKLIRFLSWEETVRCSTDIRRHFVGLFELTHACFSHKDWSLLEKPCILELCHQTNQANSCPLGFHEKLKWVYFKHYFKGGFHQQAMLIPCLGLHLSLKSGPWLMEHLSTIEGTNSSTTSNRIHYNIKISFRKITSYYIKRYVTC